ncbi:MAG TPA: diguanylate cyclase [Thermodesulfobacteriota bacterium]|nr:diguanylate cyclase [Thermodesulfobacteriota bacterium]
MLFFRKKQTESLSGEMSERLQRYEDQHRLLIQTIHALLLCLKDFAISADEIRSEGFKRDVETLADTFALQRDPEKAKELFEKRKLMIKSYIERQQEYLKEKDGELRGIIEMLTRALATLDCENENYNQQIFEQSNRIERITQLDDIKQVKRALQEEVEQVRKTVREKQEHDRKQIETLSREVSSLEKELRRARMDSRRDDLTGLYSREAFERYLSGLIERKNSKSVSFSLLFIDIESYGKMKKTYGPGIGDRIVLALAQQCRKFFSDDEFIARYAEELIAVVLPGSFSAAGIRKQARKLSKAIARVRYSVDDVQKDHVLSFSVHIGISTYRPGDTKETVTARALTALANLPTSGKNRVVCERGNLLLNVRLRFQRILLVRRFKVQGPGFKVEDSGARGQDG